MWERSRLVRDRDLCNKALHIDKRHSDGVFGERWQLI
jgi:hypothetical protein